MSALQIWLTILLCVIAVAAIAGIPMWMVLRHPDRDAAERRYLPGYLKRRQRVQTATSRPTWAPPSWAGNLRRDMFGRRGREESRPREEIR